jgi:hypothetical protein
MLLVHDKRGSPALARCNAGKEQDVRWREEFDGHHHRTGATKAAAPFCADIP